MQLETNGVEQLDRDHRPTELYETHGRAISSYLRVHGLSLEDTEDLLVEIFLAAMERDDLSTFSPGEQLAWLRRVARNKLANTYRHTQRHPQVPLDSLEESYVETEGPEQLVLRQEEHSQLRTHLQRLPALQQRVLQLRYGNGLSHAEIAILLNKREGAVRQILSRTIHFLRRIYQQTEGESTC